MKVKRTYRLPISTVETVRDKVDLHHGHAWGLQNVSSDSA